MLLKPKIGVIKIVDPRIPPEVREDIIARHDVDNKLAGLGVDVVGRRELIENEEDARREVARLKSEGICGLIIYTTWFLRSNVVAGAVMDAGVPVFLWAQPDKKGTSIVGLAVSHGALEELGVKHKVLCGEWDESTKKKLLAWIKVCQVKHVFANARYGQVGARCLSMMPTDVDANQWRWKFGIDVEHAEQWTLIHEAEKVSDSEARRLVDEWRSQFRIVECNDDALLKSAKIYLAGKEMFARNGWTFAGIKCQFEMIDNYLAPCLPISLWNDEGFVVACESDQNAAITMLALHTITGEPVMFSDVNYVEADKSIVRFLNCGTAATKIAGGRQNVILRDCPLVQGTLDKETGKSLCKGGACTRFLLAPGRVTSWLSPERAMGAWRLRRGGRR